MRFSRRHLPHLYVVGRPLFVTFRLYGSLPAGRIFSRETMGSGKAFICIDFLLEQEYVGPLYFKMPHIAEIVSDAIEAGAKHDYTLHAWVIMPNHVHLLITPHTDPSAVMRRLKGAT